jgi:hypothetical protein
MVLQTCCCGCRRDGGGKLKEEKMSVGEDGLKRLQRDGNPRIQRGLGTSAMTLLCPANDCNNRKICEVIPALSHCLAWSRSSGIGIASSTPPAQGRILMETGKQQWPRVLLAYPACQLSQYTPSRTVCRHLRPPSLASCVSRAPRRQYESIPTPHLDWLYSFPAPSFHHKKPR